MGIGAPIAVDNQQTMKGWALKERSTGDHFIDEEVAIKLLLSKAVVLSWRKVEVQIQNKQTLNHILSHKTHDMRLATVLEDIYQLRLLFHMCSFCLTSRGKIITYVICLAHMP